MVHGRGVPVDEGGDRGQVVLGGRVADIAVISEARGAVGPVGAVVKPRELS